MLDKVKGFFKDLSNQHQSNVELRGRLNSYKDQTYRLFSDLRPDDRAFTAIAEFRNRLSISAEDGSRIHKEVFNQIVADVLKQRMPNGKELEALELIRARLVIAWTDLRPDRLKEIQIAGYIAAIQAGNPPVLDPSMTALRPQKGESIHFEGPCKVLEDHVYRERVGGSHGTYTVRIAKGVYYHPGSTRGRTVVHTEQVVADSGVLSISSHRIAFIGHKQNFNAPWAKVLHAEPMSDGMALSLTSRKKTILLAYGDRSQAEVIAALMAYMISQ